MPPMQTLCPRPCAPLFPLVIQLLFQLPQQALRALKLQGQLFVNGGNCVQLSGGGLAL
jgi:hypothetical protein